MTKFLIIMKFSFLLLFLILWNSLTASVKGQNETLKINMKNAVVRDVLKEMESKTNYRFFFSDDFADIYKTVSIDLETDDVTVLLSQIFQKSTVTYKILDNNIVVITPVATQQQGITVIGVLTDEMGEAMPGVNVLVKGTSTGVVTDINGKYSITVPNENAVLQFSFIGYNTREMVVGTKRIINISMAEDAQTLDEVVVVAYGTVSRKNFAGAAEVVGEKQLGKTPTASLAQSLQGNAAGVMIATTTAEPGADVAIRIRGSASMSASNDPLILIDNMPSTMSDFTAIDPNDVISVSILKDAVSTALYGSRASNGIVMITTRRGQKGKMQIGITANYSFDNLQNVMDVMTGPQFAQYANMAYWNIGANSIPYDDLSTVTNYNFQKLLTRDGHVGMANLQVSGGSDKVTYFVSANYKNQQGMLLNSNMSRIGLRANLGADLLDNLKFTFNTNVTRQEIQNIAGGDNGAMVRVAMMNPARVLKPGTTISDAGYFIDPDTGEMSYMVDVLPGTLSQRLFSKPFDFSASGQLNWAIIPGLTATTRGSVSYRDRLGYQYAYKSMQTTSANAASSSRQFANRSSSTRIYWLNENFINYNLSLKDTHHLRFMLGQSSEKTTSEGFGVTVSNFEHDYFTWNYLRGARNPIAPGDLSTSSSMKTMLSAWASASYSYMDKYTLDVNYRADGSSRFGSQSKWGYFPSVGVKWNAKNEDLFRNIDKLSQLGIRFSWGLTGNDAISQGTSLSFVSNGTTVINGEQVTTSRVNSMGNADIKWEKTGMFNIGTDVGIFNDVVVLSLDWYYKKTTDLLYNSMLPYTTGFGSITSNIGTVENKGLELTLTSRNITSKDFRWVTNFNISWNANKVLDLGGDDMVVAYNGGGGMMNASAVGNGGAITYFKVGQPMCIFMGYPTTIWQSWDEIYGLTGNIEDWNKYGTRKITPGMLRYWGSGKPIYDENGNQTGFIPDALSEELNDFVIMGHTIPDFTVGFTNTFTYKSFELSCFFTSAWGNKIFNGNSGRLLRFDTGNNSFVKAFDSYRPMNVMTGDVGYNGKYPSPVTTGNINGAANANSVGGGSQYPGAMNETWLEDGAYLRLKSLSLAYNIPRKISAKIGMQSLSISGNAMNLWTLTRYSGMDPEMSSTQISGSENINSRFGIDRSAYPACKTYTINLNIKF